MIADRNDLWRRFEPNGIAIGLCLFALFVRIAFDYRESIWLDEAIAITDASQDFTKMPWHLLRFDMHPAVYFVQLKLWMGVSTDESWIRFNSVVWGSVAVGLLYVVARRQFSQMVAGCAAVFFAVLPGAIFYSHEIRMYALNFTFVILAWAFNSTYWRDETSEQGLKLKILAGVVIAEVVIVHTHSIGFFTVFFLGLMSMADGWSDVKALTRQFRYWVVGQIIVVLTALPVIASSLVRDSASSIMDSFEAILQGLKGVVFGYAPQGESLFVFVAIAIYLVLAIIAWRIKEIRAMTLLLVLLPPLLMVLISVGFKPMFKGRALTFTYPFMCLALAHGTVRLSTFIQRWIRVPTVVVMTTFSVGSIIFTFLALSQHTTWQDYKRASEIIVAEQMRGDVVLVPSNGSFWAMNWYLNGPNWGTPLEVHNPDVKSRWRKLGARLNADWTERLGVFPISSHVDGSGARIYVGSGSVEDALNYERVWYVHYSGHDFEIDAEDREALCLIERYNLKGLEVFLIETRAPRAVNTCKAFQVN